MSVNPPVVNLNDQRAEKLGSEITELYACLLYTSDAADDNRLV